MKLDGEKAREALVSFRKGEEKGFCYFFNTLYTPLKGYALKRSNFSFEAEEIVENAFLKAWESRSMFSDLYHLNSYLFICVNNACCDLVKKRQRKIKMEDALCQYLEPIALAADANIIKRETAAELKKRVESLPPMCRQIIKMLFFEGKAASEIMKILKTSESNIKSQKARGLMLLRKRYNVDKETVDKKHNLWVKKVYCNSSTSYTGTAKLYGLEYNAIMHIRKGNTRIAITNSL